VPPSAGSRRSAPGRKRSGRRAASPAFADAAAAATADDDPPTGDAGAQPVVAWSCLQSSPMHQAPALVVKLPAGVAPPASSSSSSSVADGVLWSHWTSNSGSVYAVAEPNPAWNETSSAAAASGGSTSSSADAAAGAVAAGRSCARAGVGPALSSITCDACATWVADGSISDEVSDASGSALAGGGLALRPIGSVLTPPVLHTQTHNATTPALAGQHVLFQVYSSQGEGAPGGIFAFNATSSAAGPGGDIGWRRLVFELPLTSFVTPVTAVAAWNDSATPPQPMTLLLVGTAKGALVCLDATQVLLQAAGGSSAPWNRSDDAGAADEMARVVWWQQVSPVGEDATPAPITAGPIADGSSVVVGTADGLLAAFSVQTGAPLWTASFDDSGAAAGSAVSRGVVADATGRVYAVTGTGAQGMVLVFDGEPLYVPMRLQMHVQCTHHPRPMRCVHLLPQVGARPPSTR